MASCKMSRAQAEFLIPCDTCVTSGSARAYCKDCLVHVCENCKQRHSQHTSVPVIEGLLEKLHPVKCLKHKERFTNYCETCRVNICNVCLKTNHRQHKYEIVGKHGDMLRQNFTKKIQSKKIVVTKIREELNIITRHEKDFKISTEKQIEKVWSEINTRKQLLDAEGNRITESLQREQKEALEKLQIQCQELQDLDIKLTNLTESLENQLSNISDEAVLDFVNENETKLESNPMNLSLEFPNPSEFARGLKSLGDLKNVPTTFLNIDLDVEISGALFDKENNPADTSAIALTSPAERGKITANPLPSLRREIKILRKFKPTGGAIISISGTADNKFWVGTRDCQLLLVKKTGKQKQKVNMPGPPYYTAVTGSGEVFISTFSRIIYKVTRQGHVSTFVDVKSGEIQGITTTQQGDVFACVKSGSECKVKKFSDEGQFKLELDSAMFTPGDEQLRVHAVQDNIVCLQDGESQLVFVTASGHIVSRVMRTDKLREDTRSICWDGHGNMLTGTLYGKYIHVFSEEGEFKQSYKVKGSKWIEALCLAKDGVVGIGTGGGNVILAKYLQ